MPRSSGTSVENNFSKGLITEATAMNFPENSVTETDNCIFSKDGTVIRRYGLDYESSYAVTNYSTLSVMSNAGTPSDYYENVVFTEYEWNTVGNSGALVFSVIQIGDRLSFFSVDSSNAISSNRKNFTVNLNTFHVGTAATPAGSDIAIVECSFASGFGYLFVTHPLCEPFYVSYDATGDTITSTQISIKTRDFERLDDTYEIDFRPSSLTTIHKYNLYNQGWYVVAKNDATTTVNVVTYWDTSRTDWPSNADVWWVYKNASELFDKTLMDTTFLGNSPAPNGHYIYSAWLTDRNTALSTSGLTERSADNTRPAVTAFYAGRVWYAGVNAAGYLTKLYFSKIIESTADFGKCYQISDPTSETNADLLETDGGVIDIPDIAQVIRIVPIASSLFVFATNGLWKISGPNGVFAANDYSITRVSNASIKAKNSIVIVEGAPMWWDAAGIYAVQFDSQSNQETVVNISETTIQSLINSIPNENLTYVKGAYNNINKTVHWLYRSTPSTGVGDNYSYDKLLILNVTGGSFQPQTLSFTSNAHVSGLTFSSRSNNDALIEEPGASLVKYFTIGTIGVGSVWGVTVSQFNNTSYLDWYTVDNTGVDYDSEFVTGYRVRGELLRKFQANWLTVILKDEDNASCFVQGVWDYSRDPADGRYTTRQQIYKQNYSRNYSRTKRRIRGSGYSLQFKFSSEAGKPFTIIGWSTFESANSAP